MELYDWLRNYFSYPEDIHPSGADHSRNRSMWLPCGKGIQIPQLKLWGVADYFLQEKRMTHISISIWDRELKMTSDKKAAEPFRIADCNYSLYGIYLNILAYVTGHDYYRLTIVHDPAERKIHEIKYRPELAAFALECRRVQILGEQNEGKSETESQTKEERGHADKKASEVLGLFG